MFRWAWKSLFDQPGSLLGSTLGIASAFILVLFFEAVFHGESERIIAYPQKMAPDIWVMQTGVRNMHMAVSYVWEWKADKIAAMPGVERVTPILYLSTIVNAGENDLFAFLVGLLPDDDRAGPWKIVTGRNIQQPGEAVIPDVFAKLAGVDIGGTIKLTDKPLKVVGLSAETYSAANSIIFIPFSDLEDITSSTGTYSYLLVDAKPGVNTSQLAAQINDEVEKVSVLLHEEFIQNDFAMAKQMGVEIIFMMTVICSILAALIVGFTAYSLVMRKRHELAIVKALGVNRSSILTSVVFQSGVMTLLGYLIAVGFALLFMPHISALVPQVTLIVSSGAVIQIGLVAMLVAIAGAMIPAFMVFRFDPAIAFQS